MPFGFKNVPMIYQRINENALWGWLEEVFKADRDWLLETDPVLRMVNTAAADMFATNEPDQSVLISSFQCRSFVDDICFGVLVMLYANEWALSAVLMQMVDDKLHHVRFCGQVLKDAEMNYHSAEKTVCYIQLAEKNLHVYTRFSTLAWVHKSKSLFERAMQFAVLLSPSGKDKREDSEFSQLPQSTITNFVDLDDSLAMVAPPTRGSPNTRMDPSLLYAQLSVGFRGYAMSFDGSARTAKNGGYGFFGYFLNAASPYSETATVNMAEYTAINNVVQAALEYGAEGLVIVDDSTLAFKQSLGVIACLKDSLVIFLIATKNSLPSSSQLSIFTSNGNTTLGPTRLQIKP
ncbi:hypothetical protein PHMEG_00013555 [Phytophthora megakarya]|uniref:Reverse transcriptase RNase H-like domain-containing protein n=1 Tax=Phytophthora megakarya TaxID=4795 RepID=A0A225W707_9STRA|nr:hypothetical protein PHMEG_00013555 [Phytophthora megakarya]